METVRYAEQLAVFVEVVRCRSFSAAARRRGVTASALSRQLDQLEAYFALPLLVRSSRGVRLTDGGERLFIRAQGILDALADMDAEVRAVAGSTEGVLRISCWPTFGKRQILPWLIDWQQNHPELRLELDLTERLANPSLERLDGAIRIGVLPDSGLYASHLGRQRWLVVASPDYLARHGQPVGEADLAGHRLLDKLNDPSGHGWRRILPQMEAALRCDDFDALREAACLGLGLALLPDWVAQSDLRVGHLRLVMRDPAGREEDIHLLRALPAMSAKLQLFHRALARQLAGSGEFRQAAGG
ncbi:LysR family transcriptional regulator [Chromobacterium sp. ASV23]|uniref:LysR family transcriptional regulator n=1 Tax=Chromobacterium sp. ASV23 TaxID=2795110 RepID=UPI0018EC5B51|nr:LysR family transcriptional regulator [Chromobacterium sp. ASV23]